ncbi:hypothetical protein FPV67DRAFT_1456010 [Lyophyllum atratum]|nr:hypothetical protein FPV67DRAFT_1456010 [Lyophyllum atratum]
MSPKLLLRRPGRKNEESVRHHYRRRRSWRFRGEVWWNAAGRLGICEREGVEGSEEHFESARMSVGRRVTRPGELRWMNDTRSHRTRRRGLGPSTLRSEDDDVVDFTCLPHRVPASFLCKYDLSLDPSLQPKPKTKHKCPSAGTMDVGKGILKYSWGKLRWTSGVRMGSQGIEGIERSEEHVTWVWWFLGRHADAFGSAGSVALRDHYAKLADE